MKTFTGKQFKQLANFQGGLCVSFYLPTHRTGQEVLKSVDKLTLKNQIKVVVREMEKRGFSKQGIDEFLAPVHSLLSDHVFWRNQSEGLAIFIASNHFSTFNLPFSVDPLTYVAYGFYLKPIVPLLSNDGNYYLLSLNIHEIALYRGSRGSLEEIKLDPTLPLHPEEVVGSDYRPKFLGYRASKMGGHHQANFHGHAEWQADEKNEIVQFFRSIDKAIVPTLNQDPRPLLVASLDHLYSLYKEANTYTKLYDEFITVNPKGLTTEELHKRSWALMAFYFDQTRQKITDRLQQYRDTDRTSTEIKEVIPAAIGGRVEALFLDQDEEIWGMYHSKNASTVLHEENNHASTSLTNLALIQVFLNGGLVFVQKRETLPLPYAPVNALLRY